MAYRRSLIGSLVGFCLVALAPGGGFADSGIFRAAPLSGAGSRPTGFALADVTGSGRLDFIVTSTGGFQNRLLVGIGFGDSTFALIPPGVDVGGLTGEIAIGDFNGDGVTDVAVTSTNEMSIVVMRGDPSDPDFFLPFGPPIPVGRAPVDVATADLNGDGVLDLVTANEEIEGTEGTLSVLLGLGNGTFSRVDQEPEIEDQVDLRADLGTAFVELADIDGDSILDIFALNRVSETISVFRGAGNGRFDFPTTQAVAGFQHFAVADIDGDGELDLAGALTNLDAVGVRFGNGDGTFGTMAVYPVGSAPIRVALRDVTGDGALDIVAANSRSQDVSVLRGAGDGTFSPARTYVADAEPRRLAFGDIDEDGRLDIAVVSEGDAGATVAVLRGREDGSFFAAEDWRVDGAPTDLAIGDINNNGYADLAGVTESGNLFFFPSQGEAGLGERLIIPLGGRTRGIAVADLNGDLRPDIVVSDFQNGDVAILRGRPDGVPALISRLAAGPQPSAITTGDFNGDGRVDIAVTLLEIGEVAVFLQNPNGTFAAPRRSPVTGTGLRAGPIAMERIDADCDDRDDLVIANNALNSVAILRSSGNGTFTISNEINPTLVGDLPTALLVADFNSDGRQDFAVTNARVAGVQRSVRFFDGRCDGTFTAAPNNRNLPAGLLVTAIAGRDFTGNRILDVSVVNQTANVVRTFLMRGSNGIADGTFESRFPDVVSRMPESIVAADFDGDGRYDLVTGNTDASANNVTVLYNCVRDPGCDLFGQNPAGKAARRGDANDDGIISAADLAALGAEIADGDGDQVEDIELGTFAAAAGVDANGDGRVDHQDSIGIARRIFAGAM